MGWCSATYIFDTMCGELLDKERPPNVEEVIEMLIGELENGDWDCQSDSEYYDHPVVQRIFKRLHPDWFED